MKKSTLPFSKKEGRVGSLFKATWRIFNKDFYVYLDQTKSGTDPRFFVGDADNDLKLLKLFKCEDSFDRIEYHLREEDADRHFILTIPRPGASNSDITWQLLNGNTYVLTPD